MADIKKMRRARLGPTFRAMNEVLGDPKDCDNILQPIRQTNGIIFPYTPNVMTGGMANYGNFHFTHSNYPYYQYQNSMPEPIQVTGDFTAQTNEEARYLLAVFKFLRASTMIEYGKQSAQTGKAGTPPPVLRFNYMGGHMFNEVPVVVTTFNYILENDVDYVEVQLPGGRAGQTKAVESVISPGESIIVQNENRTYVPTLVTISIQLQVQPNPKDLRDNFDLDKFKRGDLIGRGYI